MLNSHKIAAESVFKNIGLRIKARLPAWEFEEANQIVSEFILKLQQMREDLGDFPYIFELTLEDEMKDEPITASDVVENSTSGLQMLILDRSFCLVDTKEIVLEEGLSIGDVALSQASKDRVVIFYENTKAVKVFADEAVVAHQDLHDVTSAPAHHGKWSRMARDYNTSVTDHFEQSVQYWQDTDHWEARNKRTLRSKLGWKKTEDIFHSSLLRWLDLNLADANVYSTPQHVTSDRTDIYIAEFGGDQHVIEVKWMGTNAAKTSYNTEKISSGIKQIGEYLKKQTRIKTGLLVVYDGRDPSEFNSLPGNFSSCKSTCILSSFERKKDPARGSCQVFFLENKTASQ